MRKTSLEDYDRLAENLNNQYSDQIDTKQDLEKFYDKYMHGEASASKLKKGVMEAYTRKAFERFEHGIRSKQELERMEIARLREEQSKHEAYTKQIEKAIARKKAESKS